MKTIVAFTAISQHISAPEKPRYETSIERIDEQLNLLFWQLDSRQGIAEPMERWIEIALDQRADLKQMEFQQSTAEEEIKRSQAAYLPSLNLLGNYEYCVIQLLN